MANPKSNSFNTPLESKPTLSGFKSRKIIFLACRYVIALEIVCATSSCSVKGSLLLHLEELTDTGLELSCFHDLIRSFNVSFNLSRRIKYPSSVPNALARLPDARPCNLIMLGWHKLASMAVSCTRSSAPIVNSSISDRICGRKHFMASIDDLFSTFGAGRERVATLMDAESVDLLRVARRLRFVDDPDDPDDTESFPTRYSSAFNVLVSFMTTSNTSL